MNNITVSMIACMAKNRVIGINNQLPWKLPADMKFFIVMTKGKTVVMGRNTFESIGKPLPNRRNIVLTSKKDYAPEGCIVVHSIEEAMKHAEGDELVVIGGSQLYESCMPLADKIYLTVIDEDFAGDSWFPEVKETDWQLTERVQGSRDEQNQYEFAFHTYERIR